MARTITDAKLDSRAARLRLKAGERYWRLLDEGLHLGYRRGAKGGKWLLRAYRGDQRYVEETLGSTDDTVDADGVAFLNFAQAQHLAHDRYKELKRGQAGLPTLRGKLTVKQACDKYVKFLRAHRKTADDTEGRLKLHVYAELGDKLVTELTKDDIETWQAARVRHDADDPEVERRSKDSCNRVFTMLKAALNRAFEDEANKIPTDAAWRKVKSFRGVGRARQVHLDKPQCLRLLVTTKGAFHNLCEASLLTGARPPHELVTPKVKAFNPRLGILSVDGKTGPRDVVLSEEAIRFFKRITKGRKPNDLLLPKDDGEPWAKNDHIRPMQDAVKRAKLPEDCTLYALRHTHISQSLLAGLNIKMIADNCGTSVAMIEKHYAKFMAAAQRKLINESGFKLGFKPSKGKGRTARRNTTPPTVKRKNHVLRLVHSA